MFIVEKKNPRIKRGRLHSICLGLSICLCQMRERRVEMRMEIIPRPNRLVSAAPPVSLSIPAPSPFGPRLSSALAKTAILNEMAIFDYYLFVGEKWPYRAGISPGIDCVAREGWRCRVRRERRIGWSTEPWKPRVQRRSQTQPSTATRATTSDSICTIVTFVTEEAKAQ